MDLTSALTIAGNLTRDPETRKLSDGKTVVGFTVASTPRKFNRDTKDWEDGEPTFFDCSAFGDLADHIAASLTSGQRVIVYGRVKQDNWTDKDTGTKRSKLKVEVDDIGPSLKFGTTTYTRGGAKSRTQDSSADSWGNDSSWGGGSDVSGFGDDTPF